MVLARAARAPVRYVSGVMDAGVAWCTGATVLGPTSFLCGGTDMSFEAWVLVRTSGYRGSRVFEIAGALGSAPSISLGFSGAPRGRGVARVRAWAVMSRACVRGP